MLTLAMSNPSDGFRPKSLCFPWENDHSTSSSPHGFVARADQREQSLPSIRSIPEFLRPMMPSTPDTATSTVTTLSAHTTPTSQPPAAMTMSPPHSTSIATTATPEYVHSPSSAYKQQRLSTSTSAQASQSYHIHNAPREHAIRGRGTGHSHSRSHSHGYHGYSTDDSLPPTFGGAIGEGRERLTRAVPRHFDYGEAHLSRHARESTSASPPPPTLYAKHASSTGRAGLPGLHPLRFEHKSEPSARYGHDTYRSDAFRTSSYRQHPAADYPAQHYSSWPPSTDAYPPQHRHAHHPSRVQSLSAGSVPSYNRAAFPSVTTSDIPYAQPRHFVGHSQQFAGPAAAATPGYPHYHARDHQGASGYMPAGVLGGMSGGNSTVDGKQRKRRGNLPKETTDKLRTWFVGHLQHPYPSEDEKQELMRETGLQMNQISNWFINARRRQLPSMIKNAAIESNARAGRSSSNALVVRRNSNDSLDGRPSSMERPPLSPVGVAYQQHQQHQRHQLQHQHLATRQYQQRKRQASEYNDDRGNISYPRGSPVSDDGCNSLP